MKAKNLETFSRPQSATVAKVPIESKEQESLHRICDERVEARQIQEQAGQ